MSDDDIEGIEVRSGVNEDGVGFCHVVVTTDGGRVLLGQLTPEEVRTTALDWIGAAEAAEQDAVVFGLLRDDVGLDLPEIGEFLASMRRRRSDEP